MDGNNLSELEDLYKEFIGGDNQLSYDFIENEFHCFNNYVFVSVAAIEKSINITSANDIDILTPANDLVGYLCPVAYPDNEHIIARLNEVRLLACFVDNSLLPPQSDNYSFINHYVAINREQFQYYKTVMATTEYWGGYTHKNLNTSSSRDIREIKIHEGIEIPSINHKESMVLAVHSTSSFERFLKYYHQIELLFDALFIAKLKNINSSDLKDYAMIIKEFNNGRKTELDTLKYIFKNYLINYNLIIERMCLIQNHSDVATDMFYELGKDSNPLKGIDEWTVVLNLLSSGSLDVNFCSSNQLVNGSIVKLIKKNDQDLFENFIVNLCSYWIYRIRCSIAHNKVGEYIFSYNDESFVSEFGEHLLMEIIKDLFSNPNLHADMRL